MSERSVGNLEHIGGAGLHAIRLRQCAFQQRALDIGDVLFHVDAFGQNAVGNGGNSISTYTGGSGTGPWALSWEVHVQLVSSAQRNRAFNCVLELAHISGPIVAGERLK